MALLKCLEPVTAIACGLGAFALGSLDGGLTAGAIIGGSALIRAFGEARSKHGLESKAHIERTRLAILRVIALDDLDQAARDSVGLADTALAVHLSEAMPSREALGAAAVNRERYPAAACALILERLEQRDPLFRDDAIARDFAMRVITAALQEGLNNPEYIALLSVHILTAVAQGVAEIKEDTAEIVAWVRAQKAGTLLTDQALRGAIARFVDLQPNASDADVLNAVATFERDYRALLEQVSHISVNDNHIQSLKVAAEEALEAGDIATARTRYAEAAKAATAKASEPVRNAAALKSAEASAALTMLDWQAADAAWEQAAAMLMPFDVEAGEAVVGTAADRLAVFGEIFAQTPALVASERRCRALEAFAQQRGEAERIAKIQNNLGNVLSMRGERTVGKMGIALLTEAASTFQAVLNIYTQTETPTNWAIAQNNLGNALSMLAERVEVTRALALLAEAVTAYRAALTVRTLTSMPTEWSLTQSNLGAALWRQGLRMKGDRGLALLAEAVKAYRAALTVRKKKEMPAEWSGTQTNLGIVLSVLGERTVGAGGLVWLTDAIAAFRAALSIQTRATMPADWSATQNNLGNVLRLQGERAGGDAGLGLLKQAIEAYRAALTVWTPEHFSYYHKMARNNLTEAEAAIAARRG